MFYYNKSDSVLFFVIAISLLLISPLLSLPYIIYGIYRRFNGAVFCFLFFLGLVAYVCVPFQDLYRQMLDYYSYKGHAVTYADITLNGIIVCVYRFFITNNISYDYIRLIQIPISFGLLYSIARYKIKKSCVDYSYKDINFRLLLLFLFYDLLYTIYGVRYGFALCLYLFGVHLIIDKGKTLQACIFILLAISIHQAFLFLGVLSFIIYNLRISKKTFIVICILAIFVINIGIGIYGRQLLGARYDWYFSGKGDNISYSHMTMWGLIGFVLPKLCALPFVGLLLKFHSRESKWCRMALSWLVIAMMFLSNAVLFYRTWWVFMAIGIYLLLDIENYYVLPYKNLRRIAICGFFFGIFNSFGYHKMMQYFPLGELCKPVPAIISHSYSKSEVVKLNSSD